MDQLIQAFGIDVKLIIIQLLNFGILLGLLVYFLYKPLLKVLAAREEKIAQGIKDAESAAAAKATADEEKKGILSMAHKNAEEVGAKAKNYADEKAGEIAAEAQTKAESIIKNAEAKSVEMKEQARKDSEAEIAKLAVLAAEKVLKA
ncbi:MAG: F-type H+-transporting ATPase subunit b [Patiriisocius sp.]|jgi:F-type H+-transporting ATPase subunit b